MPKRTSLVLLVIVVLALILRLVGINHGYPFIFHTDEPAVVRSALDIRFHLNPGHFDWPHLYIYGNFMLFKVFAFVRGFLPQENFAFLFDERFIFYLLSRILSAVLGSLTVIPVFLIAYTLFKRRSVALFSALVFCLFPFHIRHSHYALIDVPMIFFLSWAVFFASKIFNQSNLRFYIFAGLFVGLAASTKYHGALASLVVLLAHTLRIYESKTEKFLSIDALKKLVVAGLCSVLGFFAGTPFALLDFSTFIRSDDPRGALWQFTNVGDVPVLVQLEKFFQVLPIKLADDIGYVFLALFVLAVVYWCIRVWYFKSKETQLFFVVVPALIFLYYICGFEKTRSHYLMISYPFIAVAVGYIIEVLSNRVSSLSKLPNLKTIFISTLFCIPFFASVTMSAEFLKQDSRVSLYHWLQQNNTSNRPIYLNITPPQDLFRELNMKAKKIQYDEIAETLKPSYIVFFFEWVDYDEFLQHAGEMQQKSAYIKRALLINDGFSFPGPLIDVYTKEY